MVKVVSLFAGIGGFDLGFSRAGYEMIAHVEIDPKCRQLLAARWPNAIALDDVRTAGKHNLPACDIITFGFPCQDLSVADKRAGLKGERSGLFYEATRIIRELRPTWALFENVPGLLSSGDGADFAAVLSEMGKCGYSGAWRVLDAQWLGVAQRRRRVFGLFTRLDSGGKRCAEILSIEKSLRGYSPPRRETREKVARNIARCLGSGGNLRHQEDQDTLIPVVAGTLLSGKNCTGGTRRPGENGVDDITSLIPIVAKARGACATATGHLDPSCETLIPAVAHSLRAEGADASEDGTGRGTPLIPAVVGPINTSCKGRGYCADDAAQGHYLPVAFQGKAPSCQSMNPGNVSPALDVSKSGGTCVAMTMQVRRLTPTECERLQGFPDGWTAGFSDSTRYKMLGNAVCVNVAEWIARRLKTQGES